MTTFDDQLDLGSTPVAAMDHLLMTTRAIRRRLDLDRPVPRRVIEECLEIAVHAPTASNGQLWRWVVVAEPSLKAEIARYYRLAWGHYRSSMTGAGQRRFAGADQRARAADVRRTQQSAEVLAEHLHEVPLLVIPCVQGRTPDARSIDDMWRRRSEAFRQSGRTHHQGEIPEPETVSLVELANFFGSIYPAVWSFQVALRARGLGSSLTSMHLPFSKQVGELLGIPPSVTQTCMLPVGYIRGEAGGPAPRTPAAELTCWDHWSIERVRR
jgi:nitroreductase